MAQLHSIKGDIVLKIKPIRYEYSDENWIICQIIFFKEGKETLSIIENILQDYELKNISDALIKLVEDKSSEYKSDFLEPNLKIDLKLKEKGYIQVFVEYVRGEDYENRENEKNYYRSIDFFTDKDSVNTFVKELTLELENLQKHNASN